MAENHKMKAMFKEEGVVEILEPLVTIFPGT